MRVFLDTNVIVGAVATRGLCADIMREVLTRHQIIVSEALFGEIETVLARKIGVPSTLIEELVSLLREGSVLAAPLDAESLPIRDPADRVLVAAALAARAELFVTGDAELLRLQAIGDLAIVSPRAFWERAKTAVKK